MEPHALDAKRQEADLCSLAGVGTLLVVLMVPATPGDPDPATMSLAT